MCQVNMAMERNLAICLHIRLADEDGLRILAEAKVPKKYRIHFHCFNSDWNTCERWLEQCPNFKVGFTPMITYSKKENLREVIANIPLTRLLLDTDSPYFLPRQNYFGPIYRRTSHVIPDLLEYLCNIPKVLQLLAYKLYDTLLHYSLE